MSKKNTGENRSEKARETAKKRRPDDGRKRGKSPKRPWAKVAGPVVASDHGCMVAGNHRDPGRQSSPGKPLFRVFFEFFDVWSPWFSQILILEAWYPLIFVNITNPPSKSFNHHRTLRNHQPTDEESTLSAWPIVKSTGQMFLAHWYQPMYEFASSSDIKQHADPSMIIARRIPKDAARPATLQAIRRPINAVNWPVYDKLIRSLTHYSGRPNQKQANGSYKSN